MKSRNSKIPDDDRKLIKEDETTVKIERLFTAIAN